MTTAERRIEAAADDPIAWVFDIASFRDQTTGEYGGWREMIQASKPHVPEGSIRNLRPLIAAVAASPASGGEWRPEPGIREQVVKILWRKQFEGTPWHDKFDLIRPDSLDDYGALADKIIATVKAGIEECFTLIDRRSPASPSPSVTEEEIAFLLKVREVLSRRFPRCRDCADDGPICPNSGLPCDLDAAFAPIIRGERGE